MGQKRAKGCWRSTAMGLFLALCLAALPANAEVKSKPPAPEENVYRLFVSINRRCEATVHVENIKTGWNRDYILSAEELDAAVEWSRNVGTVATKSVVLVDYGRDTGAFFRGSTRAALYAFVLSAVSKRVLGDPGKWARRRFFWVSVAAGGALEVANLYIFGDPEETKGQRILREALLKFEALEEDE